MQNFKTNLLLPF